MYYEKGCIFVHAIMLNNLNVIKMKNLFRILSEYRFIKTANVIYKYQNVHSERVTKYQDDETIFIERCFAMDIPQTGSAVIFEGQYYRVATIWHNRDENCVEVDLNDL